MSNRKIYRYALILVLLVAASLSCKTVMNPDEVVEGLVSTQIEGIVTDIDIESLTTDMDLGAIVTDMDIESIVTDMDFGDGTPAPGGQRPADIPIMPGQTEILTEASDWVMYNVTAQFQAVIDFYEKEMPANGWSKVTGESKVESDYAYLVFEKQGRKAVLEISPDFFSEDNITVTISITP
jgi:hypothetical protein